MGEDVDAGFAVCWSCGRSYRASDVAGISTQADSALAGMDETSGQNHRRRAQGVPEADDEEQKAAAEIVGCAWRAICCGSASMPTA